MPSSWLTKAAVQTSKGARHARTPFSLWSYLRKRFELFNLFPRQTIPTVVRPADSSYCGLFPKQLGHWILNSSHH
jgi:hypothetical protein